MKNIIFKILLIFSSIFFQNSINFYEKNKYFSDLEEYVDVNFLSKKIYIKQTEVTQKEWSNVMGSNPSFFDKCGDDCPVESINFFSVLMYMNKRSKIDGLDECYTLEGCQKNQQYMCKNNSFERNKKICLNELYCEKVNWNKDCKGYRLPTENEWDSIIGYDEINFQNTNSVLVNSKDLNFLKKVAIYGENSEVKYVGGYNCPAQGNNLNNNLCGTSKVGQKNPNKFHIYDMIGNVQEFVWDSEDINKYDFYEKNGHLYNVFTKGCSWSFEARFCLIKDPNKLVSYLGSPAIGVRPVRTVTLVR